MGIQTVLNTVRSASVNTTLSHTYLRINCGALHLVESVSDLFQIGDVSSVRIKSSVPQRSFWEGIDEELLDTTWVNLEMEFVRDRV